ncbi:hypothetical protein ST201phi2-1p160 [Pseudomonas phage 201phi2-1]|uniref:Uncharacterized protein n=1 Tax=Pseudomonas phage 201phi2-1 TaxID=198110 RepID=B3FJ23_BP201|nr:hypothetical protein ST201phi2-1p160 [Pseudomonas phage 201phi2-1]ABY62990.1 hypothetical protein 201phi2-1p160 [Pseudomonas phage 201phi2-1]
MKDIFIAEEAYNPTMMDEATASPLETYRKYDAYFNWFLTEDFDEDTTVPSGDHELFNFVMTREKEYRKAPIDKMFTPPTLTWARRDCISIGGKLLESSHEFVQFFGYTPGTLIVPGMDLEPNAKSKNRTLHVTVDPLDPDPERTITAIQSIILDTANGLKPDIDEGYSTYVPIATRLMALSDNADEVIEKALCKYFDTRSAIEFLKADGSQPLFNPIPDFCPGQTLPKWYIEAWILNQEFIKYPEFQKNICRIVFEYAEREITRGNLDIKKILNYLIRLGRFNTRVYLIN